MTHPRLDRIRTERDLEAMVALDNIDLLADRVERLLSHGRRISIAHRYATYAGQPPELSVGLMLDEVYRLGGDDGKGLNVRLVYGRGRWMATGFGLAVYGSDGNDTEANAWKRYHAGKDETDRSRRRRDMTHVFIVGGLEGDGPGRSDQIVIQHWNGDGVCDERVIGFDLGDGPNEEDR